MSKNQEQLKEKVLKDIRQILAKDKNFKGTKVVITFKDVKENK